MMIYSYDVSSQGGERVRRDMAPQWAVGAFVLVLALWSYPVVRSMLEPLGMGAVMAFALSGPKRRLCRRANRPALWASLLTLGFLFSIVIPTAYGVYALGMEVRGIASQGLLGLVRGDVDVAQLADALKARYGHLVTHLPSEFGRLDLWSLGADGLIWLARQGLSMSGNLIGGITRATYTILLSCFFGLLILKDWEALVRALGRTIPLGGWRARAFLLRSGRVMRAVIVGSVLTGLVQGGLGALGWWFSGLPNWATAGLGMFACSFIPVVGTALVWLPGAAYLALTGSIKGGLILAAWGALVVSSIDPLVRPLFMSSGEEASTLLMMVGVLGGLAAWGVPGLFMGPVALHSLLLGLEMTLARGLAKAPSGR